MSRETFRELVCAAIMVAFLIGVVVAVTGCTTQPTQPVIQTTFLAVCAYQPLGTNESGIPFLAMSCDTQEAKK